MGNNKMERFNRTFRERGINFRGLKKMGTSWIGGIMARYNYTEKHVGLGGQTSVEDSKIKVDGLNK